MSKHPEVVIVGVGMTSALGLSAQTTAAAVRAGLSGYRATGILDRRWNRVTMAYVPDDELPPLSSSFSERKGLTTRKARMLQLAGAALNECLQGKTKLERIPILLAVPDAHPGRRLPVAENFLTLLAMQAGIEIQSSRSRLYHHGRAGGLMAIHTAVERLRSVSDGYVVIGGVDSYLDLHLLATLDMEDRIRAMGNFDGFTPGEGAAFLLLTTRETARRAKHDALARIDGAAWAEESGHRYSQDFYRGDGLDKAFQRVFADVPTEWGPTATVYAGFNGEHFHAKEWGVAHLRHREHFVENVRIEHPADSLGDIGAALGPALVGLSAIGMQRGYRRAPCLVWCSSDKAERAAALLSAM